MQRVIVDNVSKKFEIGYNKEQTALEGVVSVVSGKEPRKTIWALKDVSFSAQEGEILGIIGNNGAGKTTLLRTIAGIYVPDKGSVFTEGKVVSIIGSVLKERLTMKDAIYATAPFFGISRSELRHKYESIVDFTELHDFQKTKLYQFSSGMKARVGLSIAIHSKPDILLLDGIFDVGDKDFKQKSVNSIKGLVEKNATVLLATHSLPTVAANCDRAILLDSGGIACIGKSGEVIREYEKRK